MNRNKRKKAMGVSRSILKRIAQAESITFPHLESFSSLPLRGEEMEQVLLVEVAKELSYHLSQKYWDEMESPRLTQSLAEIKRVLHCIKCNVIPK